MTGRSVTGIVVSTRRARSSVNGNPAFYVTIEKADGERSEHRTSTDAGIAYEIENREYRDAVHTFHLTAAGRITHTS